MTAGTLQSHHADIEEQAQELFLRLVKQYAAAEGVKASAPLSATSASRGRSGCPPAAMTLSERCLRRRTKRFTTG